VQSEHAIGILKGRFQSLKELRIQISSHQKHEYAKLWIICCLILHNLIIRFEEENGGTNLDEWLDDGRQANPGGGDSEGDRVDNGDDDNDHFQGNLSPGQLFCEKVMDSLFTHLSS